MENDPKDERSTFLRVRDVLERTESYLDDAVVRLATAAERVEDDRTRARLLLRAVESHERELGQAVADYRTGAPDELLDIFTQYTADFPDDAPEPPEHLTVETVTDWAVDVNDVVRAVYRELSTLTIAPSVEEALANLRTLVEGKIKDIARVGAEARDL